MTAVIPVMAVITVMAVFPVIGDGGSSDGSDYSDGDCSNGSDSMAVNSDTASYQMHLVMAVIWWQPSLRPAITGIRHTESFITGCWKHCHHCNTVYCNAAIMHITLPLESMDPVMAVFHGGRRPSSFHSRGFPSFHPLFCYPSASILPSFHFSHLQFIAHAHNGFLWPSPTLS